MAAGLIICREAGATVTDTNGGPVDLAHPTIVVTNGHLHPALLALLNEAKP